MVFRGPDPVRLLALSARRNPGNFGGGLKSMTENAEYQDRTLKCADCGEDFVFTAGEQIFFADKHFRNDPKRCKPCKAKRNQSASGGGQRTETTTVCSQCGKETTVPFRPTQGRPVFCRECFQQHRVASASAGQIQ